MQYNKTLLSSITVLRDSIHMGSMSPSNTIHLGLSVVKLAISRMIHENNPEGRVCIHVSMCTCMVCITLRDGPSHVIYICLVHTFIVFCVGASKALPVPYSSYSTKDQRPVLCSYQIGAVLLHFAMSSTKTASLLDLLKPKKKSIRLAQKKLSQYCTLDGTKTCSRESIRTDHGRLTASRSSHMRMAPNPLVKLVINYTSYVLIEVGWIQLKLPKSNPVSN